MGSFFHDVVTLQSVDKSLDQNCVAKMEPSKCMFPQESLKNIRTPVFLVNTAYDYWQVRVTNPSNIMRTFVLSPFWFYCNS